MRREKEIKSYKGGEAFKRLLSSFGKHKQDLYRVGLSPAVGGISSCTLTGTPISNPGLSASFWVNPSDEKEGENRPH
jgi:hypothetical protein